MSVGPTIGERITNLYIALSLGLVATVGYMVLFVVFWRQGRRGPLLLCMAGLAVITLGLILSSAVRLLGLTHDTDASDLAFALQMGGTALAFAIWTLAVASVLVSRRRRASIRE